MLDYFTHKYYTYVGQSLNHKQKMNNLMDEFAQGPLVVLQKHDVVFKGTRDWAVWTMQPWLVRGSPIGQAYKILGGEYQWSLLVQHAIVLPL